MKARIDYPKGRETKGSSKTYILVAIVVVIISITASLAIYVKRVAPFRTPVLVVDETSISMRYFLKRLFISGIDPLEMLATLAREQIIKQIAPQPPYNINISDEEIDQFTRDVARGRSETISESEFKEWYRQQLNESRLSDSEFRDLMQRKLLSLRMKEYLSERVPTIAEQVHLYMIAQQTFENAITVKELLDDGEDFFELARQLNTDEQLKEHSGDLGWYPRGALAESVAQVAFDELDIGQVSEPLSLGEQAVAIIIVAEKAAAREIDEEALQAIKAKVLADWLADEYKYHKVTFRGFSDGYDSETDTWVRWQLQKLRKRNKEE